LKGNDCHKEETTQRMGELVASYSSHKRLISRIYKDLKKINHNRTNNPRGKQANELNR
jgi:hypothetical protein